MIKTFPPKLLLILVVILAGQAFGQKPPKGDTDVAATTTIQSGDGTGTFFRIQSDGLGNYMNGVDSVQSIVQAIGDWEMDAKSSGARRVFVDFGDPVVPGTNTAPFGAALVPARFISKCTLGGMKIRNMTLGQEITCPLALSLDYGGSTYRITMNPVNYPASEWVRWTCNAVAGGRCVAWTMDPNNVQADGERKARGELIKIGSRRVPDQSLGTFHFAFRVNVTTP